MSERGDGDPRNSHHKMAAVKLQLLPLVSVYQEDILRGTSYVWTAPDGKDL